MTTPWVSILLYTVVTRSRIACAFDSCCPRRLLKETAGFRRLPSRLVKVRAYQASVHRAHFQNAAGQERLARFPRDPCRLRLGGVSLDVTITGSFLLLVVSVW